MGGFSAALHEGAVAEMGGSLESESEWDPDKCAVRR